MASLINKPAPGPEDLGQIDQDLDPLENPLKSGYTRATTDHEAASAYATPQPAPQQIRDFLQNERIPALIPPTPTLPHKGGGG